MCWVGRKASTLLHVNLLSYISWNFCANLIIFLGDTEENKGVVFYQTPCSNRNRKVSDLPENKMFVDNMFHCWVTPHVTVQHLAWELLHVLNVHNEPLIGGAASITRLHSTQDYHWIIIIIFIIKMYWLQWCYG